MSENIADTIAGKLSNKPRSSPFHQQRLKAWHPVLTAKNVFPVFLIIGLLFTPIGIVLLLASNSVREISVDYTHCTEIGNSKKCSEKVIQDVTALHTTCKCSVDFELKEDYKSQVYFYYGLTNFYQNHRRYVISRDDNQLHGIDGVPNPDCDPYRYDANGKIYAPCGAVAMSFFNDTFTLKYHGKNGQEEVPVRKEGIAWYSDVHYKFGKPSSSYWNKTVKPVGWRKSALERTKDAFSGDEELMVWMRIAPLPTFRKLHRLINHKGTFSKGLPAGKYSVDINYAYPVTQFGGTKRIILSTISWLGGRNPTLGIAYLVLGSINIILGLAFLLLHYLIRHRLHK